MKKILILFFYMAGVGFSYADDVKSFADQIFKELDVNGDGTIDKKDIEKFSKREFHAMDKNGDRVVSKDEFFTFVCDKSCKEGNCECKEYKDKENLDYLREYWKQIDKNSDGVITYEEKLEKDLESFYNLDIDGNGKITREEIETQFY